jgi:putative glutamine amidotransferase
VCPEFYDGPPHAEGTPEDLARDSTTLPLIRAAIAGGLPLLAICRGFQELNVALGGSLDQRIQDLPGRLDHSTPSDQRFARVRTAKAHGVRLAPGSFVARLAGAETLPVNSLHNQGIARLAPRLVAEGWAPDGTIEAVRVAEAPGFAYGVQWHPEYDWQHDALSRRIFESFGEACAARAAARANGVAAPLAQAAE